MAMLYRNQPNHAAPYRNTLAMRENCYNSKNFRISENVKLESLIKVAQKRGTETSTFMYCNLYSVLVINTVHNQIYFKYEFHGGLSQVCKSGQLELVLIISYIRK